MTNQKENRFVAPSSAGNYIFIQGDSEISLKKKTVIGDDDDEKKSLTIFFCFCSVFFLKNETMNRIVFHSSYI
jgi:hypothetical protein